MISFSFNLRNPFSDRWETIYHKDAMLGKHLGAEIQIIKDTTIIDFGFRWTTRQDHAGMMLDLGLFGYSLMLHYYDTRHWNDEEGRWYVYGKDGTPH